MRGALPSLLEGRRAQEQPKQNQLNSVKDLIVLQMYMLLPPSESRTRWTPATGLWLCVCHPLMSVSEREGLCGGRQGTVGEPPMHV